jgi:hypothetical protein
MCFADTLDPIKTFEYGTKSCNDSDAAADWSIGDHTTIVDWSINDRALHPVKTILHQVSDDMFSGMAPQLMTTFIAQAVENSVVGFRHESESHRRLAALYIAWSIFLLATGIVEPLSNPTAWDLLALVTTTRITLNNIARISPIHGEFNTCTSKQLNTLEENAACDVQADAILGHTIGVGQGVCWNNRCYSRDTLSDMDRHSTDRAIRDPFTNADVQGTDLARRPVVAEWRRNLADLLDQVSETAVRGCNPGTILDNVLSSNCDHKSLTDQLMILAYLYLLYTRRTLFQAIFGTVPVLSRCRRCKGPPKRTHIT